MLGGKVVRVFVLVLLRAEVGRRGAGAMEGKENGGRFSREGKIDKIG